MDAGNNYLNFNFYMFHKTFKIMNIYKNLSDIPQTYP